MSCQIEEISPVEKRLTIEVPWPEVAEKLERTLRTIGRAAELPGFRKGKAPRSMILRLFGKKAEAEVTEDLIREHLVAGVEEHKLEAVGEPVIDDLHFHAGEHLRFVVKLETRAPVELKQYEGLTATRKKVAVADAAVDATLERLREGHTQFQPITGRDTVGDADVIVLQVKGTVGDQAVNRPEVMVNVARPDRDPLPGLGKALVGLSLKAKDHPVELDIPADAPQKEIAGKHARLLVTVLDARSKAVPALDDEFAKDTGQAETLADLRLKVRAGLEEEGRKDADREARAALLKELVRRNPHPVPASLVERGIDSQISRVRYSLAMQGMQVSADILKDQATRDRIRDGAADEVRGRFILEAIADKESVEVSDEELEKAVAELAAGQGKPAAKIRAEMNRDGTLGALRFSMRQEKTLDLVFSRATITDAEPAPAPAAGEESP